MMTRAWPINGPAFPRIRRSAVIMARSLVANRCPQELELAPPAVEVDGGPRPAAHDGDRVAQAEQLGQVGADEDDRLARRGHACDDLINLRPAAHDDPSGA